MTLTARDKKIVMLLAPLVVILAFWFLVFSPKRSESAKLGDTLTAVEGKRDAAEATAQRLEVARNDYAKDYATVVSLGKAVPSSVDMPSLLVQLESAAKGTGINFDSIKAGARATAPTQGAKTTDPGQGASAAGGEKATTGAGQATEKANDAKATSEQGSAPAGGSAAPAAGAPAAAPQTAPGLDSVPLDFSFTGSFFDLADFFHDMKRFVAVTNGKISVKGRLMTIDSLSYTATRFPTIDATVKATVYLSPKSEGTTAGGTPAGPGAQSAAASGNPSTSAPTSAPAGAGGAP